MKTGTEDFCKKISFTTSGDKAGKLTIVKVDSKNLYDKSLIGTPIWLKVKAKSTNGKSRHIAIDYENVKKPKYKATFPFNKNSGTRSFPNIFFGEIVDSKIVQLDEIDGENKKIKMGGLTTLFHIGFRVGADTIGTGDLRNGKINNTVFDIDQKDVYLNIIEKSKEKGEYILELGYGKS